MRWREQVLHFIDGQDWLDQVDQTVTTVVEPALEQPEVRRLVPVLRGDWLGHPLHPALTDVPIGCWTASVLLDLVGMRWAAGLLTAAGTAGAAAAAAAGVIDWTATEGRARRLGLVHAALNSGALGLQLCSLGARVRGRRFRALRYSVMGLTVASAAAWFGGEMVYGETEPTPEQ